MNDFLTTLKTEMEEDSGNFVSNIGNKRPFPEIFSKPYNQTNLKIFYEEAYNISLNNFVMKYSNTENFKKTNLSDLFKAKEALISFIFGNNEHLGAYSAVSSFYAQQFKNLDVPEIIIACEKMFLDNYKIKLVNGIYTLFSNKFEIIATLGSIQTSQQVFSSNYIDSVKEIVEPVKYDNLLLKNSAQSFEIPASTEKSLFSMPENFEDFLIPINYVEKEKFVPVSAKQTDNFTSSIFKNNYSYAINVSFIGNEYRNYFWLALNYVEQKILAEFSKEYGFLFIKQLPVKFIVDEEGYLVSKFTILGNDLSLNSINYPSINLQNLSEWLEQLTPTGANVLQQELATLILLKLAFGVQNVNEFNIRSNDDVREIYILDCYNKLVENFRYKNIDNNEAHISLTSTIKNATLKDIINAVKDIKEVHILNRAELFNLPEFRIVNEGTIFDIKDNINVPISIFKLEYGVFYNVGKQLIEKDVELFQDELSLHVKNSGLPENSDEVKIILNRLALFSLITYMIKENIF